MLEAECRINIVFLIFRKDFAGTNNILVQFYNNRL